MRPKKNLYKGENFKPEIKPMIENLQRELNKQAKGAKLQVPIGANTFFEVPERQNMKNQAIFELYTNSNKSKYSSNPKGILKSAKKL